MEPAALIASLAITLTQPQEDAYSAYYLALNAPQGLIALLVLLLIH